jgi:glycosyltransferase involved in cell wall biosynthesis
MKLLIAIPVYNEELILKKSITALFNFCQKELADFETKIIIADNNSSDNTKAISQELTVEFPSVSYLYTDQKGKGIAWRLAFQSEAADIYVVMDADLAVNIDDTLKLVAAIESGFDLAIGSRYLPGSSVKRPWLRDLASVTYRALVRFVIGTKITDFQCGFKAINKKTRDLILPLTKDNLFFLDTEIIVLCELLGYSIKEVPVDWSEYRNPGRKSTVNVGKTAIEYLFKIQKLKHTFKNGIDKV